MMKKSDLARHIVYWYKTAKENFKEGYAACSYIAVGRGQSYIAIAREMKLISHDEWRLLKRAFDRLW